MLSLASLSIGLISCLQERKRLPRTIPYFQTLRVVIQLNTIYFYLKVVINLRHVECAVFNKVYISPQ